MSDRATTSRKRIALPPRAVAPSTDRPLGVPDVLRPATIRRLQAAYGNQAVQRLIRQPASSLPIQRRVPRDEVINALGNNPAVLGRLRKTVTRTVLNMPNLTRELILERLKMDRGAFALHVKSADVPALKLVIVEVEKAVGTVRELDELMNQLASSPKDIKAPQDHPVRHPGADQKFVPWDKALTDAKHQTDFTELVNKAATQITTAGADDVAIKRVFGDQGDYATWAKQIFGSAAAALLKMHTEKLIGADLTGEAGEMRFGGLTNTSRMMLSSSFFFNLKAGNVDACLHTLCHESFHAGAAGVKDEGGYRDEKNFPTRTSDDKLRNAEHYVEVIAQVVWGEPVRTLRPPNGVSVQALDDVGTAHKAATDVLRSAWVQGLNIHDDLLKLQARQAELGRQQQEFQRAQSERSAGGVFGKISGLAHGLVTSKFELSKDEIASLSFYSRLLGLTLHSRTQPKQTFPTITDLDLTLSEGVVKALALAYGTELPKLPTDNTSWQAKTPLPVGSKEEIVKQVQATLQEQALTAAGPIRHSLARDKAMVASLYRAYKGEIVPSSAPATKLAK